MKRRRPGSGRRGRSLALGPNPALGGLLDPSLSILSHSSCSTALSQLLDKHPAGSASQAGPLPGPSLPAPASPPAWLGTSEGPTAPPGRLASFGGQASFPKTPFPCYRLSENLEDAGEPRPRELELLYVCEGEDAEAEDNRPPLLCSLP